MKKGDFVLMTVFGVLLVFVIAIFVFRPKAVNCVVYENRNEIASFSLNEDVVYTIRTSDGHENVLQIKRHFRGLPESDLRAYLTDIKSRREHSLPPS